MKIIIKVGTSCIIKNKKYIDYDVINNITKQISKLQKEGHQVILIASGAVGLGKIVLKPKFWQFRKKQEYQQINRNVIASCGQSLLTSLYFNSFNRNNQILSQILLTRDQINDSIYTDHISYTINEIWKSKNIIPFINENDTIVPDGFNLHDNDELTAFLAKQLMVDKVVILSSVDGVYKNSTITEENLIKEININKEDQNIEFFAKTDAGRGGMSHKIDMCEIMAKIGVVCHIYNGKKANAIMKTLKNPKKYGTIIYKK